MKKMYALMVCMTVCGAALFAQTAADFTTEPEVRADIEKRFGKNVFYAPW
jgi:hypothetical protein